MVETAVCGLTGAGPHTEVVDLNSLEILAYTLLATAEALCD